MKKKKLLFLFISVILLGIAKVEASSNEEFFKVADENALVECFSKDNICELSANINLTSNHKIASKVILDLKGFSIEPSDTLQLKSGLLTISRGGKLTIIDSHGNGKISTGASGNVWAAIQLPDNSDGEEYAELVVNGGTIEGYYYGITGNGKVHNSIITINGGTIRGLNKEDSAAIFQPQNGKMVINNGIIEGGTGIEIRSGDLTINGGTIKGISEKFIKMINTSGTTTNGVGIAVAQHTTKNPINVVINNGTISGQYAFYEWNPHNNNEINKVKISINNGNFTALDPAASAVYSENFTNFINGGDFNTDVSKYLSANANAKTTIKVVEPTNNITNSKTDYSLYIVIAIILTLSFIGLYYYNYKVRKN